MAEVLIQGLLLGGVYALIALGFAMIFKSSQVLNLAYGQQMLILSYFLWWLLDSVGLPTWLSIIVIFALGAGLGFAIERGAIRPLLGQPFLSILMMTLLMGFLLKGIVVLAWGGISHSLPFAPQTMIGIGDVQIMPAALYGFIAAVFIFGLMLLLFKYTKIGLAMRVVAADNLVSQSMGIRVKQIFSLSWVVSGGLAAICGIFVSMVWMITPDMGDIALGKGLPVLLLGGMNSIPGALAGGLIIGITESLGGHWGGEIREIVPWLVMLTILLIRPWGIFGEHRIERI
jgi:branched-chain amino acid transport system permease protein